MKAKGDTGFKEPSEQNRWLKMCQRLGFLWVWRNGDVYIGHSGQGWEVRKPGDSEIEARGEAEHRPPYFQSGN